MPARLRAILFTRRSKSPQLRLAPSHFTAGLSGKSAALRATRIGIETNSGKSASVGCGTSCSALMASRPALFLGLDLFDRATRLLPGAKAALEMRHRRQSHVLRRLGRERRAPGAGTE